MSSRRQRRCSISTCTACSSKTRVGLWASSRRRTSSRLSQRPRSSGLTSAAAAQRLAQYGPNDPGRGHGRGAWRVLAAQFTNRLVLLLLIAAVLSLLLGEH